MTIPIKKAQKKIVEYLTPAAIKLLLEQPDKHTHRGGQNLTLMSVLYDYWSTCQEVCDLKIGHVLYKTCCYHVNR